MKKAFPKLMKATALVLAMVFVLLCVASCGKKDLEAQIADLNTKIAAAQAQNDTLNATIEALNGKVASSETQIADLNAKLDAAEKIIEGFEANPATHEYDFYMTLGTMPTLYATLNAYEEGNPNTYMWFFRGNTISYEYTAKHIQYFTIQSTTNANSVINYRVIREKVMEILAQDPDAKFNLYCDDLRTSFILQFVYCGVDFEDLNVTLLSDGTGTYDVFANQTEEEYATYAENWDALVAQFKANRGNPDFTSEHMIEDGQAMTLQNYIFYLTTFPNVELWVQHPQYLKNESPVIMAEKELMNLKLKNPKDMYQMLDEDIRMEYQKAVLANALVDNDTLNTLEEAAAYFNANLANRDKEVVLIIGTNLPSLADNQSYLDQTVAFYTPTRDAVDATKVLYKNVEYTVAADATTVLVDGEELVIGEMGVYLFFKGHPMYKANDDLRNYFVENGIIELPYRTPVETLLWMFDVKVGGYNSTSFLSCMPGQTEFFYGEISGAVADMAAAGFFDGAVTFVKAQ